MGPLPPRPVFAPRQDPTVLSTSDNGINGAVTIDSNGAPAASSLAINTNAVPGQVFSTAPNLVSTHTPVMTLSPAAPSPVPTAGPADASATADASSSSATAAPISLATVVGSCVAAFIGAVAFIALGFYFYRRYQRSLKASYRPRGRGPLNNRADSMRRRSHREPWDKLEDSNPEDKWEGRNIPPTTEESVAPMEKLTMFKKSPSVRTINTAVTHFDDPQFEMSHPLSQPYSLYNKSNINDQSVPSLPVAKPFMAQGADPHVVSWNDTPHASLFSAQTQSEHLSGSMSPSLSMAIPTPPATSSPLHHWESAEIMNFDGQSAEIVNANPFGDQHKALEGRKSGGNPFFGAHNDVPKRRSRSNSVASRASKAHSDTSSVYIPVPRLDKGKGRAIDPFDDEHAPLPPPTTRHPTLAAQPPSPSATSPTSPLPTPQPAFATHVNSPSGNSVSSNDRALASLLAALDGATTEEEVHQRIRITPARPSLNSTYSMYSETDEDHGRDVTREFPLPPSTPGHTTPTTINSYVTAESNRTAR